MLCFLMSFPSVASSTPEAAVTGTEGAEAPAEEVRPGTILFDARVPTQVSLDGSVLAQLFLEGELRVRATPGRHELLVMRNGNAESLAVDVPADGTAVVVIGRNGTSTGFGHDAPAVAVDRDVPIDLRVTGSEPLQLRVDATRLQLSPGDAVALTLPTGSHPMSLRSADGTAVFATGTLAVGGSSDAPAVLQVAEGRLPEASGALNFHPTR